MTHDWKSTKVQIIVWMNWTDSVATIDTYLDTDTMAGIFSLYDPAIYTFEIHPADEDDDE